MKLHLADVVTRDPKSLSHIEKLSDQISKAFLPYDLSLCNGQIFSSAYPLNDGDFILVSISVLHPTATKAEPISDPREIKL